LGVTWDRLDVFWYDPTVFWFDPDTQSQFPAIVSGNQQGFIHYYMDTSQDDASLSITAINVGVTPVQLTIPNHNLETGEIVYITGIVYTTSTDLNNKIYQVKRIDADNVALLTWDTVNQQYDNVTSTSVGSYIGGGRVALFPLLQVQTKDFNPYQEKGAQLKLSHIDFLTDATPDSAMTIILYVNSSPSVVGNLLVGNQNVETYLSSPYYVPNSQYAWHRFYSTAAAQYLSFLITYDDNLRNTLDTYRNDWQLNAFTLWVRPGGKIIF
jgi:hypothetical protein